MKRVLVLLNEKSGTLAASTTHDEPERIRRGFQQHGVFAEVRGARGDELARAAAGAGAEGFDAVVGGGGDGTLNTIANALAGGDVPFAVLPLGTHNHFAREMGVPLELDAAVAALARGRVMSLDLGAVNGRIFLNFSGLGLHPSVVKQRDIEQEAIGGTRVVGRVARKVMKIVAGLVAFVKSLEEMPVLRVSISADGRRMTRLTPSVIVCNNPLQMKIFGVENCSYPSRALLNVYVAKATGSAGIIRLIVLAVLRRLDAANARDFESMVFPQLRISMRRRRAAVSIDGEVVDMPTPLEYRVRRAGLKVIVPGDGGMRNVEC